MEVAGSITWAVEDVVVVDADAAVDAAVDAAGCVVVVVVWEDIIYLVILKNFQSGISLYYQYIKFYINYCV